jgi:GTPase SAR1 family protein
MDYRIKFKAGSIIYDLEFKGRVSKIGGDSGAGKTFFSTRLAHYYASKNMVGKVTVFNYTNRYTKNSAGGKGRIMIIDNADVMLGSEEIKSINADKENQYIIFSRQTLKGLMCRIKDHYELITNGETVKIKTEIEEVT